jgi:signal transduction histidine kinase
VDVREPVSLPELMDDALRIAGMGVVAQDVAVIRDYAPGVRAVIDRHKTLQILVNLIRNAKHAISATEARSGRMVLRIRTESENKIRMEVEDDGVGIPEENMVKIFRYGFTTKSDGHGFGLHGGALAAKQIGGTLSAASRGVGRGATFSLVVPGEPLPSDAAAGTGASMAPNRASATEGPA